MDNFADHATAGLCYFCFIMATFISQVTMLNMLVAIMGDTFERIIENRTLYAIKTKLQLMGEQAGNVKDSGETKEIKVFMFVV